MTGEDPPVANTSKEAISLLEEKKIKYYVLINDTYVFEESDGNFTMEVYSYRILRKESFPPGNGGSGGCGGLGGSPGEILVFALRDSAAFTISNSAGIKFVLKIMSNLVYEIYLFL